MSLQEVVFDDTSLNKAADSHITTCNILACDGDDDKFQTAYVRQKKIYSVLSFRNRHSFNVKHFGEVSVEFLPKMLVSIQGYAN